MFNGNVLSTVNLHLGSPSDKVEGMRTTKPLDHIALQKLAR